MNFKVLVFLALLVGGLLYLNRHQQERESTIVEPYNGPLLGGAMANRISDIRWDHVEQNRQVALERRKGVWRITDPIDFPAAPHQIKSLVEGLFQTAREVPAPDTDAVASHFDPPRIAVTLVEEMEGGVKIKHKFRVGALDADGMQVEIEKDGRYFRVLRNLDTALAVSVHDLRKRRLFDLNPDRLLLIERSGFSDMSGSMLDLAFKAGREGPTWQQTLPMAVQLDPSVMSVWGKQLCSIYAEGFASDIENPDLAKFGLHMPNAMLKLTDASGNTQEILFAETGAGTWVAKLADQRYIYSLRPIQVELILSDWSMLRDTRLMRAHREDIGSIQLAGQQGVIRLTQGPALDDDWTVANQPSGQTGFGPEWLAEKSTVQEFLGLVEQSEVTGWLPVADQGAESIFAPGVSFSRLEFNFRHMLKGESTAALIGPTHTSEAGTELRTYARVGDEPVGLVPLVFQDWLNKPLHGWRSRLLWNLKEGRLARLRLTQGAKVREYKRKIQGTWTYMDADTSPVELLPALDHLVFLRADQHFPGGELATLTDPVRVEFMEADGTQHSAEIGPDAEGEIRIQLNGMGSLAKYQELHSLLAGILNK
ncbi:MAG: hypothetical protein ACI87O_001339 [Planctomycetota bacterium]|jgi:hypothetical protein